MPPTIRYETSTPYLPCDCNKQRKRNSLMMNRTHEEVQKELIRWFSHLPVEVMQRSSRQLSKVLKHMGSLKTRPRNTCFWRPCSSYVYARGLCARHYQEVRLLAKETGESLDTLAKRGICATSMRPSPTTSPTIKYEEDTSYRRP